MKYSAVLFDLDGTLLDTLTDLAESVNSALDHLNLPPHKLESYKYFIGNGREAMAFRALPTNQQSPAMVTKLVAYFNEEYSRRWANNTLPYQGVPELLDALSHRGIRMAILSNKPHDFTELMVSRLLSKWQFDSVVGALPSVPKKPNPAAALKITRQLNIRPVEFLYLGDTNVDMETATAACMYPVGALWGFRTAGELLSAGARLLLQKPTDLLEFL
jgi:phosphoglycolate phosphatase